MGLYTTKNMEMTSFFFECTFYSPSARQQRLGGVGTRVWFMPASLRSAWHLGHARCSSNVQLLTEHGVLCGYGHAQTQNHANATWQAPGDRKYDKSDEERGALGGMGRVHENYERTVEKHAADTTSHVPSTQLTAQMHHTMANHPATRHQNRRTHRDTGSTIKSNEERGGARWHGMSAR